MAESSTAENTDTELTMCDVLQEEQELEEDANAVLGGSDDTNCSYDQGYVPRQALYACSTCSKDAEPAGICLACCYACHDGHEVVELYTKRNFRCDCGNNKFPEKKCNLRPDKEPFNSDNKYNQNFRGVYCSCSRPYPDLDDSTVDEMIQCVMCEDWYHGRHIGGKVPENEDYGEMVCENCMKSHNFLYSYLNHLCFTKVNITDDEKLDIKNTEVEATATTSNDTYAVVSPINIKVETVLNSVDGSDLTSLNVDPTNESSVESAKQNGCGVMQVKLATPKMDSEYNLKVDICILKTIEQKDLAKVTGPAFWPENWRKQLCHCSNCMEMYRKLNCEFLLNLDDTIQSYEERGKCHSGVESQYDKGMSALGQLDRVKQMEAVRAYTNMKGKLKEYLKEFADNKRTVCESDIKEFFEQMSKKRRLDNGVPHFCR